MSKFFDERMRRATIRVRGAKQLFRRTAAADLLERARNELDYEDVFLVSFPKSGNTWMRFVLTGVCLWYERGGAARPNYYNIHTYVPDLHLTTVDRSRPVKGLPRILKSHRPYTPNYHRVIYVVRDVRDAMISRFHFLNRRGEVFPSMEEFLDDPAFGVAAWVQHVESWLSSPAHAQGRVLVVRFEDLAADPEAQIGRILAFLDLDLPPEAASWIAEVSDKRRVRELEANHGRPRPAPVPFLRRGTTRQWKELIEEQLRRIEREAAGSMKLAGYEPELVRPTVEPDGEAAAS